MIFQIQEVDEYPLYNFYKKLILENSTNVELPNETEKKLSWITIFLGR